MRSIFALGIIFLACVFAVAQSEEAPIVEKDLEYKNWTYKNVQSGADVNLREFIKDKKLVAVVYFAPWCGNWRHNAPMLQKLYDKYKDKGFAVIAVGEYDPAASMKSNFSELKLTFPVVYESENRTEKQKTTHYGYRTATGDTRNWGSPYYVLLDVAKLEKKGEVLSKKTSVINGEMIEADGEKFIRQHLGLPMMDAKPSAATDVGKVEVCDPAKPTASLKKNH